jgi:FdrA protein
MVIKNIVKQNTYLDSIMLMAIGNQIRQLTGAQEASLIMGTDANKEILKNIGLLTADGQNAGPGDVIIAIKVNNDAALASALKTAEDLMTRRANQPKGQQAESPKSIEGAIELLPGAGLVFISVPGQYAADVAMEALENGRHVMIFSDNVPVEEEIRLKKRARELDLLVMGPDCGTAIVNGVALGFANVVRRGPFGIVGASGTGIQEVTTLLHKRGYGISHAIGLGGRDLSQKVMGISMLQGIRALEEDPLTEIVILISKPPAPEVANLVLDTLKGLKKKYIVNFLKGDPAEAKKRNLPFAAGLEEAANLAISIHEGKESGAARAAAKEKELAAETAAERKRIGSGKKLRGLFSGGTLADEALVILSRQIGDIRSNIPLREDLRLANSWESAGHTIVDLGEDEFTRGRPHPMIDFSLRCNRLLKEAEDPACGVILLDVVLGYAAHENPAGELVPVIRTAQEAATSHGRSISFVTSITGTDEDPQRAEAQQAALEAVGVRVLPSNARAARYAGMILGGK